METQKKNSFSRNHVTQPNINNVKFEFPASEYSEPLGREFKKIRHLSKYFYENFQLWKAKHNDNIEKIQLFNLFQNFCYNKIQYVFFILNVHLNIQNILTHFRSVIWVFKISRRQSTHSLAKYFDSNIFQVRSFFM